MKSSFRRIIAAFASLILIGLIWFWIKGSINDSEFVLSISVAGIFAMLAVEFPEAIDRKNNR